MPARTKKSSRATRGHIDVKSKEHVGALEKMLKNAKKSKSPVFVLVYMNGCGPCNRYKEEYWNNHVSQPGMYNKAASVHYDQLPYTSLRAAKLKGYPSVININENGALVDHPDEESPTRLTNAMPSQAMRNLSMRANLNKNQRLNVNLSPSPYSPPLTLSPSYNLSPSPLGMNNSGMNTSESNMTGSPMNTSESNMNTSGMNMARSPMNMSAMNTSESNMNTDENQLSGTSGSPTNLTNQLSVRSNVVSPSNSLTPSAGDSILSGKQTGGALLESMLAIAKDPKILTAALLTLTAAAAVSMKKKTRRSKKRGSSKRSGRQA